LILALFGCGGSSGDATSDATSTATADAPPASTPASAPASASASAPASASATSIPADLAGQWETTLSYVPPFYSGPYGDIPAGDGSIGISFTFSADGGYHHVRTLATAYFGGNCFRTSQWDEAGTVSGAGTEFTFNPGKATYMVTDSCGQNQYVDPAPVTAATHSLTLDRDSLGWPLLRMSFPSGELVLEKCRHCQ
jgi:hypothetical protein